jgi:hypothetical protein
LEVISKKFHNDHILTERPTLPVETIMELLEVCLRTTYFQVEHELPSFSHQENIAKQHKNENVDLHEETSNIASACDVDVSTSTKELVSQEEKEGSSAAVQIAGDADRLEEESQSKWARCTCRYERYNNFDCKFCC